MDLAFVAEIIPRPAGRLAIDAATGRNVDPARRRDRRFRSPWPSN